jgi:hypothetical protein
MATWCYIQRVLTGHEQRLIGPKGGEVCGIQVLWRFSGTVMAFWSAIYFNERRLLRFSCFAQRPILIRSDIALFSWTFAHIVASDIFELFMNCGAAPSKPDRSFS